MHTENYRMSAVKIVYMNMGADVFIELEPFESEPWLQK
jgi:hypothetical protein